MIVLLSCCRVGMFSWCKLWRRAVENGIQIVIVTICRVIAVRLVVWFRFRLRL